MTELEKTSHNVLASARQADLDAMTEALAQRQAAIAAGETPTREALAIGEETKALLHRFIQDCKEQDARLEQIQRGFLLDLHPHPHLDYRG